MKKITVNGYEVTTNYGAYDYPFSKKDGNPTMTYIPLKFRETEEEALERLAPRYSRITFYKNTTCVRGYYNIVTFCKRREG